MLPERVHSGVYSIVETAWHASRLYLLAHTSCKADSSLFLYWDSSALMWLFLKFLTHDTHKLTVPLKLCLTHLYLLHWQEEKHLLGSVERDLYIPANAAAGSGLGLPPALGQHRNCGCWWSEHVHSCSEASKCWTNCTHFGNKVKAFFFSSAFLDIYLMEEINALLSSVCFFFLWTFLLPSLLSSVELLPFFTCTF